MTQEMLKNFPYDEYATLIQDAGDSGVHITHCRIGRQGGATIAWRRVGEDSRNRMVEVSMSFCSPRDVFIRRVGSYHALTNFFEGASIILPIGSVDTSDIHNAVRRLALTALYSTPAYMNVN